MQRQAQLSDVYRESRSFQLLKYDIAKDLVDAQVEHYTRHASEEVETLIKQVKYLKKLKKKPELEKNFVKNVGHGVSTQPSAMFRVNLSRHRWEWNSVTRHIFFLRKIVTN